MEGEVLGEFYRPSGCWEEGGQRFDLVVFDIKNGEGFYLKKDWAW